MRKQIFNTAVILLHCFGFAVIGVEAQSGPGFRVKVPFDFAVKDTRFPAGTYKFGRLDPANPDMLMVKGTTGKKKMVFLTQRFAVEYPGELSELTFHRFGDLYYLSSIRGSGEMHGSRIIPGKSELELLKAHEFETVGLKVK